MADLAQLSIGTVAIVPLVVALVEAAKALGMNVKYAPILDGVLSVGGYAGALYIQSHPEYLPTVETGLVMATIFLASTGLYNRTLKAWRSTE